MLTFFASISQEVAEFVESTSTAAVFSVWFLIGAILVFFMQGGFAMVETGFTRAKNAGNIIMKNLMDFCIGTVMFVLLGFSLMLSENYIFGFIGVPNIDIFTDFGAWVSANGANFVFNLVFCATAATIVSGAMAERTKFSAYCLYSGIISLVVYPIEAGWVWNLTTVINDAGDEVFKGGWLANLGYIDFAGSSVIHMVGGITSLIGAIILGPRIGKYITDKKTGKKTSRAIPGHSITLGALGTFILWFCWYGFNGAAATDATQLGYILLTTTIAPAVATCVTMCFTWIKNGKPDVSMSLNGSLAGLVAITAPCANVDAFGALIIGVVAGFLVVIAVEVIDLKWHVDDPVGAIAVHGANGIWGTIAAGLFATSVPDGAGGLTESVGLFYGGGVHQLGVQALGVVAIAAWTTVTMTIVFLVIKKVNGLRVSKEEEISGLDLPEHGLVSSYADFMPITGIYSGAETTTAPSPASVEVITRTTEAKPGEQKLTKITAIFKQSRFDDVKAVLNEIGVTGLTVTNVMGCGMQKGSLEYYRGAPIDIQLLPKVQVDIVISKLPVSLVVDSLKKTLYTGNIGDGKIFVTDIEDVIKVRTGESGYDALQDE
jgi:Amt family ammonium transporter